MEITNEQLLSEVEALLEGAVTLMEKGDKKFSTGLLYISLDKIRALQAHKSAIKSANFQSTRIQQKFNCSEKQYVSQNHAKSEKARIYRGFGNSEK